MSTIHCSKILALSALFSAYINKHPSSVLHYHPQSFFFFFCALSLSHNRYKHREIILTFMKNITKKKFFKAWLNKWRKMGSRVIPCAACESCYQWATLWPSSSKHGEEEEDYSIPRDVPKGHLVVYVGENYKRYVIKITLLKHPLFKALLDQARDVYDFTINSKLCIPCEENTFLDVIHCAASPQQERKIFLCL